MSFIKTPSPKTTPLALLPRFCGVLARSKSAGSSLLRVLSSFRPRRGGGRLACSLLVFRCTVIGRVIGFGVWLSLHLRTTDRRPLHGCLITATLFCACSSSNKVIPQKPLRARHRVARPSVRVFMGPELTRQLAVLIAPTFPPNRSTVRHS
jgi:hypothetical protein